MTKGTVPNDADDKAGAVVLVRLLNALEDRTTTGKWRPALLIRRLGGQWKTMGLTTLDKYKDGSPRIAIPNPRMVGLRGPGYIWGERTSMISALDVGDHLGWVDPELAEAVITQAHLPEDEAAALRDAAFRHHGGSPGPDSSGGATKAA